jgi:hypothetical protein
MIHNSAKVLKKCVKPNSIKERMAVDHVMENNLDPSVAGGDGQHNQVTLVNKATDPILITGTSVLYAKSDGLYFRNSSGIVKII